MADATQSSAIPGQTELAKTRIEALCDGVFAIAMTLMIFNIKAPSLPSISPANLTHSLFALWPHFFAYAISFVMLGVYWVGHHNQFHYVRRSDRVLLWVNIAFLMFVTVIPFSTVVLGNYPASRTAVILYALNLILVGLMLYCQWWYATALHRLVDRDLDPMLVRLAKRRILTGPVILLFAIAASWVDPRLSILAFAIVPVFYVLPGGIDHHWSLGGRRRPVGLR